MSTDLVDDEATDSDDVADGADDVAADETTDGGVDETDSPAAVDTDARQLLYDLVSIPSPSGDERAAAGRLVAFFEAHDREVWIDEVGNVRAPADDSVLLTSHVDTVPGDIPVEVKDGEDGPELWGRGSVDATGPLASMAAAAVETGVSFVGVVGEETDSRGARHLIEDREAPDAVVNGEPSGWDGVTLGYRGFLAGTYVATSESGHTSRPEPNAIQHAVRWWGTVEDAFDVETDVPEIVADDAIEDEDGADDAAADAADAADADATADTGDADAPIFEQVTTKPVTFDGGLSADGLSVEATVDVQLRVPPKYTPDDVRERAETELEVGSVHWDEPIPPVMESPRTELARAFRVAIRGAGGDVRLLRKTGTSDMNLYAAEWDCPMVTYGPGDSDLDHAPDEHLSLAEFDRSVDVLRDVCERRT